MPLSIIASFSLQCWKKGFLTIRNRTEVILGRLIKYLWDSPPSFVIRIAWITFYTIVGTKIIQKQQENTTTPPLLSTTTTTMCVGTTTATSRPRQSSSLPMLLDSHNKNSRSLVVGCDKIANQVSGLHGKQSSSSLPSLMEESTKTATTSSTTTSSHTTTCNKRRNLFLARSLASRTVSFIESELENVTSRSRFLTNHSIDDNDDDVVVVARLRHSEIITGTMLGQGGFSQVYAVDALCLSNNTGDCASVEDGNDDCNVFTDEECHSRNELAHSTTSLVKRRYVVKQLRPDLQSSVVSSSSEGVGQQQQEHHHRQKKFHNAAADLVIEATFLSRINHPNIIKLRGWATGGISCFRNGDNSSYFLILDRLDETLGQRIKEWRKQKQQQQTRCGGLVVPTKLDYYQEKLDYADQLASAIQYLHRNRIMHRDITPNNIGMIHSVHDGGTKTIIQLFDFGLVRELPNLDSSSDITKDTDDDNDYNTYKYESKGPTTSNTYRIPLRDQYFRMSIVGTSHYMAPEVTSGWYNQQADIYSFTVVLYEMMTLIVPQPIIVQSEHTTEITTRMRMIHQDTEQQIVGEGSTDSSNDQHPPTTTIVTEWPIQLQQLFHKGWSYNPRDRPNVDEVRQYLQRVN
jgi:serine/threonine protein kinase